MLLVKPVLNQSVIISVVRPLRVNVTARVVKCVTSTKKDSNALVRQDTRGTGVKSSCLLDHAKASWPSKKWKSMKSTTLQTNRTSHSQSTASLVRAWCRMDSGAPDGLWSSLTPCKTMMRLRAKLSTYTTCQSTKMHLNGTATVCQCLVWSSSKISPLTGEPLVIFRHRAWTTEITGERPAENLGFV